MNKNFFKTLSVNILIFAYIVIVLINFFHNSHNYYIKSEELSQINNKEVYLLKKETLKEVWIESCQSPKDDTKPPY